MLLNPERTKKHIVSWLEEYLKNSNKSQYLVWLGWHPSAIVMGYLLQSIPHTLYSVSDKFPFQVSKVSEPNDYLFITSSLYRKARELDALVLGTRTKNQEWYRGYPKEEIADLYPLWDLYDSEVFALLSYLNPEHNYEFPAQQPSSENLEWASRQEQQYQIISAEGDPVKHPAWLGYIQPHRELIAKLNQREKLTRHKKFSPVFPKLRHIEGLVV